MFDIATGSTMHCAPASASHAEQLKNFQLQLAGQLLEDGGIVLA